jgi:hypothetical protein
MKNKPRCAALVNLHTHRKLEKMTGVAPVNDERANINWNVPPLLNTILSDKFENRFAMRGKSLDKEKLDNSIAVDELLFIDVIVAYNNSSNAAYGKLAYSSVLEGWSPYKPADTYVRLSHFRKQLFARQDVGSL